MKKRSKKSPRFKNLRRPQFLAVALVVVASGAIGYKMLAPARASGYFVCESYGGFCLNAAPLNDGNPVYQEYQNGRDLNIVRQSDGYFKLQFAADQSKCVGVDLQNDRSVIVKGCTGIAVDWAVYYDAGGMRFTNHYLRNTLGLNAHVLSGDGVNGDQFTVRDWGANGALQNFYHW